jgi:hypothetical protein
MRLALSVTGSVLPAIIGIAGTVLATRSDQRENVVALLVAWTVVGYLMLTDFGLTRAASRLAASGENDPQVVAGSLWRASLLVGVVMSAVAACLLTFLGGMSGADSVALWLLCVVPVLSSFQFPLVGLLEARGAFGALAVNRTTNAVFSYLVPALLVGVAGIGVLLAMVSLVGYRVISVVALSRTAGVSLRDGLASATGRGRARDVLPIRSLLTWVAVSSMLGPAFLYLDRVVLAQMDVSRDLWIYYVAVSELMIKTYVLPAAVLSVIFPWLVVRIRDRRALVSKVFLKALPALALGGVAACVLIGTHLVPAELFVRAGLDEADVSVGRVVLIAAAAGTFVNWLSQAYIAVLHALDRQRRVALSQMVLILPYALGLVIALRTGDAAVLALIWASRILFNWLVLVVQSWNALRVESASQ